MLKAMSENAGLRARCAKLADRNLIQASCVRIFLFSNSRCNRTAVNRVCVPRNSMKHAAAVTALNLVIPDRVARMMPMEQVVPPSMHRRNALALSVRKLRARPTHHKPQNRPCNPAKLSSNGKSCVGGWKSQHTNQSAIDAVQAMR